jgi:hypothetical protein
VLAVPPMAPVAVVTPDLTTLQYVGKGIRAAMGSLSNAVRQANDSGDRRVFVGTNQEEDELDQPASPGAV